MPNLGSVCPFDPLTTYSMETSQVFVVKWVFLVQLSRHRHGTLDAVPGDSSNAKQCFLSIVHETPMKMHKLDTNENA